MLFKFLQASPGMISHFILVLGFIVIFLGVLLLVILVFSRRKQNELFINQQRMAAKFESELLQSRIEVQEDTFRHIGKELHDNIGQLLSSTKMLIGLTERNLTDIPETLVTANETVSQAILEVRSLSRSLDREWLEQFSFLENLEREINRVNAGGYIEAKLHSNASIPMKPEEQVILFRMVQEAMQNALRHAEPKKIDVVISQKEAQLEVKIINDGKALPVRFHGMGTNNMRQRARLFGGVVDWISKESTTEVNITLPIKKTA